MDDHDRTDFEHHTKDVPTVGSDEPTDDTSGGPLSSDAGEGSGQGAEGAPDLDVPLGGDEGV